MNATQDGFAYWLAFCGLSIGLLVGLIVVALAVRFIKVAKAPETPGKDIKTLFTEDSKCY
jgi:hypothetical protein